jgi:hypothetical protein
MTEAGKAGSSTSISGLPAFCLVMAKSLMVRRRADDPDMAISR